MTEHKNIRGGALLARAFKKKVWSMRSLLQEVFVTPH